jgi:hypothetical protein
MAFSWGIIFLISLTFCLLVKTTLFKKIVIFIGSLIFLRVFIFDYLISSFGVDLHPKVDKHPIIYSRSGAKLHVKNVCNSRNLGDEIFLIPNLDINALIDSNGTKIQCATHLDYDNNEIRFNDTHGSTIWLEGDLAFFGYEYVEKKGKYQLYNKYDIGEKRTPLSLPEKIIITYISDDGYRVRIDQNLENKNKYSVYRRISDSFELEYYFKRNVKTLEELEKIDNTIATYARSISQREK